MNYYMTFTRQPRPQGLRRELLTRRALGMRLPIDWATRKAFWSGLIKMAAHLLTERLDPLLLFCDTFSHQESEVRT